MEDVDLTIDLGRHRLKPIPLAPTNPLLGEGLVGSRETKMANNDYF
jgi:hypothetical protein